MYRITRACAVLLFAAVSAMRSPQFWLLALSFGICGLTTSGLFQAHLIPHGIEHGFSEMTMAMSLGVMARPMCSALFYPGGYATNSTSAGRWLFII